MFIAAERQDRQWDYHGAQASLGETRLELETGPAETGLETVGDWSLAGREGRVLSQAGRIGPS